MLQEATRSPQVWLTGTELDEDTPNPHLTPPPHPTPRQPRSQGWNRSSRMGLGRVVKESFLEKALKDEKKFT